MALIDEIKEQTVKLKDMTFKEKADYIWHYYKWHIIGIITAIICIISITSTMVKNSRPVYLFAEFINCNLAFDNTSTIQQDFIDEYGIDINKTPVYFDFNTVLQYGGFDNTANYGNQMRILAEYNANQLDIVCAPESVFTNNLNFGSQGNFEELLPEGMLDELIAKGYEPYYYTEAADPDYGTPETTYVGGIYIDNCEYLNKQGHDGVYTVNDGDRPILTIAVTSENVDHAVEFIRMITK